MAYSITEKASALLEGSMNRPWASSFKGFHAELGIRIGVEIEQGEACP